MRVFGSMGRPPPLKCQPQASENDRFVALELLKNANIASGMVLPGCQDTGTAIIMGKRGQVHTCVHIPVTVDLRHM